MGREGWGSREASMGGAPALAGHDAACGCRVSSVVSKIFAVKKKKKIEVWGRGGTSGN